MSLTQELIKFDVKNMKNLEKDVVINLQKLGGQAFTFKIGELDKEYVNELQESTLKIAGKQGELVGTYDVKIRVILDGCKELKDKELREHFACATPKELIEKIMTSGEIDKLFNEIQDLNGYKEEDNLKKKRR